jgi:hypothetical protein
MKVICLQSTPTESQTLALGFDEGHRISFELTPGREYVALGLSFQEASKWNKGVIVLLRDDIGRCAFVPICLLKISDAAVSSLWRAKKTEEANLCLWPEEFFAEFFHDDLSDGVPAVQDVFRRVCELIANEHVTE